MTIDGLNPLTTLTAGDELPVWDVEASAEEPTKKITAQNMAASVKTLGSLVNTSEMNSALAGKQNTLTFDTTPTTGSTNPVTSGGVASAIAQSTAATAITPTAGTNVTINDCHCYTSGKLACINISFTMTADASAVQNLISGLPAAKAYVPVIAVRNLSGGGSQCGITISGNLVNNYDGFASGKKYFINCCYAIA